MAVTGISRSGAQGAIAVSNAGSGGWARSMNRPPTIVRGTTATTPARIAAGIGASASAVTRSAKWRSGEEAGEIVGAVMV